MCYMGTIRDSTCKTMHSHLLSEPTIDHTPPPTVHADLRKKPTFSTSERSTQTSKVSHPRVDMFFYTPHEVPRGVWSASERVTGMSKSQYFGLAHSLVDQRAAYMVPENTAARTHAPESSFIEPISSRFLDNFSTQDIFR